MALKKADPKERRSCIRLPKNTRVEYHALKYPLDNMDIEEATVKNIGGGGLMFESNRIIEVGTVIQVDITLQGWHKFKPGFFKVHESSISRPVTAIAEVVRTEEIIKEERYEIGVKFINIYEDDLKGLIEFMDKSR
ncbi:MAG: PilZ domain-containing protein [Thermodesulfobacteriota bacterium]|nr:PilZ domain-containing protein [Thermodesulfobacteriota bacterium]